MPLVSRAQARWAYWQREHGPEKTAKVAREFIKASPHGKGAYSDLPMRVKPKKSKKRRSFGSLAMS